MNLLILFLVSLGAATLLPGGSEALFIYELSRNEHNIYLLLLIASCGNTLGSCINFFLGKYANTWALEKQYISQASLQKAHGLFERYGFIALWMSWMPVIGDPLTFVAGVSRYTWWKFLFIVSLAKTLRYGILGWAFI